jgi:uncharacterized membrane protein
MGPPHATDRAGPLARFTPDSRRWRRRIAAVAACAAPLAAYAAVAIISGVKSGLVYNLLVAAFGTLALTLPAVAAASLLAPPSGATDRTKSREADAVETLKRRYAAGEVDEAEFERRLDALVRTERAGSDEPAAGAGRGERARGKEIESVRR